MYKYEGLINGDLVSTEQWIEIISPVTLEPMGQVPAFKEQEINLAFQSAKTAQVSWAKLTLFQRINYLKKWRDLIEENIQEIAQILIAEVGKNEKEAINEVVRTIEYIDYTFEEAKRIQPEAYTGEGCNVANKLAIFEYVPKGIALAISPFNYPINLSISKIIPSLVMGNTVVFKPATNGSVVGLFISKLFQQADLPKGIFNSITGKGKDIGDLLITNEHINLISFTGSVPVGKRIMQLAKGKELVLELGGKDSAIVLNDANLEKTVNEIISGAFGYSGQRCTAIKRVITTNKTADKLVPLLKAKIANLKVGSPYENSDIIPLIDVSSANYVQNLIDDALNQNAVLITGNKKENNLVYPTLIDHVTEKMRLALEEPFGPILPIIRCDNIEEMIRISNDSNFGLQASVFTQNINSAIKIAKQLEVGSVNINGKSQRSPDSFPFLGIKDSGLGVQGIKNSLLSSVRLKGIVFNY